MEINYVILVPVVLAVIALIFYLVRRNNKDRAKYEKESNDPAAVPDKHPVDKV